MADVAHLERALTRLLDEREILQLLARYCYHADGMRDEDLLALFTEDAELLSTVDGTTAGSRGLDRIRDQIADPQGHHGPEVYGKGMHLLGLNPVVELDGETATASTYSLHVRTVAGALVVSSASSNRWSVRKVDGHWRIASRHRRPIADPEFGQALLTTDP